MGRMRVVISPTSGLIAVCNESVHFTDEDRAKADYIFSDGDAQFRRAKYRKIQREKRPGKKKYGW